MSASRSENRSCGLRPRSAFRLFIKDEGGYTSLAVMLAVALAVVLCFSAVQSTWVGSVGGTTQYVADASALAAQNVVAKYMTIAKVLDAVILSLSLTGILLLLVATVLSCIPYVQAFADPVFEAGKKVLSARNDLSTSAVDSLNKMQDALPLLMQVNASTVARENAAHMQGVSYSALVLPFPLKGEPLSQPKLDADTDTLADANKDAQEKAQEAEGYEEAMNKALEEAFRADCVDAPLCMRQRATTLAGMGGANNPTYMTSEHWSFAVPLERAKTYYRLRFLQEQSGGLNADPVEAARDLARREFYAIAIEELVDGYAKSSGDLSEGLYIPILPKNTADMRQRSIYTEVRFPVSTSSTQGGAQEGAQAVIHYATTCPGYAQGTPLGFGSLAQQEAGAFGVCPRCDFSIKTLGATPSASTNINNGFEYYYRIVALAAERYRENAEKARDCLGDARSIADSVRSIFEDALKEITGSRVEVHPPGEAGCVVFVSDSSKVESPFGLGPKATAPPRLAMSAAAFAQYPEKEGATVLTNAFAGITGKAHAASGGGVLAQPMLGLWGDLLNAYGEGIEGIKRGVTKLTSVIPGFSSSSSNEWGSGFITDLLDGAGLAPADTTIVRPVLVNSARVLSSDEGGGASGIGAHLANAQRSYLATPGDGSGSTIDKVVSMVDGFAARIERLGVAKLESEFHIGSITLFGPIRVPITIMLPPAVIETGTSLLSDARTRLMLSLQGALSSVQGGYRQWR